MRGRLSIAAAVTLTLAVACSAGDQPAGSATESDAPATEPLAPLSDRVEVNQIAIYQAVKNTLVDEGALVDQTSPVIAGRPALVRVHARGKPRGQRVQPLVAKLHLEGPGGTDIVLQDGPREIVPLDDAELWTTFHFDVPGEVIRPGVRLRVALHDPVRPEDEALTPIEGPGVDLDAKDLGTRLRVKVVPIRYDNDGSRRLPVVDERQIQFYRDTLFKMFPVADVDLTVRDEMPWQLEVDARGQGWNALLDAVINLRRSDDVSDDVYYVGVVAPTDTIAEYCERGCILGMAPAAAQFDISMRVAMMVGYGTRFEGGTLAQELAHAMGRLHAPCGTTSALDRKYPYNDGGIGVWGWDLLEQELIDPDSRARDFMSYCQPVWVSDYTFSGIHTRMKWVEETKRDHPDGQPGGPSATPSSATPSSREVLTMRSHRIEADGTLVPGPVVDVLRHDEDGVEVTFENAAGGTMSRVRGLFRGVDQLPDQGRILLPLDTPQRATRVRVALPERGLRVLPLAHSPL
jgi:hypothetical protein